MTPPALHVTVHAVERYIERIDPRATWDEALAVIRAADRAVQIAFAFGCRVVRLGNGAQLVLQGTSVVTVLPRHFICRPPHSSAHECGGRPEAAPAPIPARPATPIAGVVPHRPETKHV